MNLSHAVGLICYILARGNNKGPACGSSGEVAPGETQRLIDEAGALLKKMNFLTGDAARNQTAMRHLQRLIVRASPNKAELAWLWALLRHAERQTR